MSWQLVINRVLPRFSFILQNTYHGPNSEGDTCLNFLEFTVMLFKTMLPVCSPIILYNQWTVSINLWEYSPKLKKYDNAMGFYLQVNHNSLVMIGISMVCCNFR